VRKHGLRPRSVEWGDAKGDGSFMREHARRREEEWERMVRVRRRVEVRTVGNRRRVEDRRWEEEQRRREDDYRRHHKRPKRNKSSMWLSIAKGILPVIDGIAKEFASGTGKRLMKSYLSEQRK